MVALNKLTNVAVVLNAMPSSSKTYGYGYYQEDSVEKNWLGKILHS